MSESTISPLINDTAEIKADDTCDELDSAEASTNVVILPTPAVSAEIAVSELSNPTKTN
eukprot:CAMPEP_0194117350 /NCGR_PEP_ID=MMETSP0150-20130528/30996_1 /TAXON_ID=122233 /ORGANISM="Chaetoceros debilis, Strain MM31A-1" /LENGTH=58 /DNA_ID=CAMNT_0038808329 /DNA_START=27 /DNA_END=200 /DNA_ORIENTATION=+